VNTSNPTQAEVLYNGRRAGLLTKKPGGYVFAYDPTYLGEKGAAPISLGLPLQSESFESKELFPFFDGLLPEGWLQEITIRTLHIDADDRFGLLLATGRHTIGAVSVRPLEGDKHDA
jgi:serine/threonine-protein kinase HipA